ncbi:MAG: hypothetical protein QNJ51_08035 [Calothrix sp. MO_167.B12]|nr:hypothetical protein [Calothrix sp. MO_167.B12]
MKTVPRTIARQHIHRNKIAHIIAIALMRLQKTTAFRRLQKATAIN